MTRVRFARPIGVRLMRSPLQAPIPTADFDVSHVADASTRDYAYALRALLDDPEVTAVRNGWAGTFGVHSRAFVAPRPLLPLNFREIASSSVDAPRGLEIERRARSIIGVVVHHSAEELICFDQRVA